MLKIPNAALRFFPQTQHVRESDKELLEGRQNASQEQGQVVEPVVSAKERAEVRKKRNQRHVWVPDGAKVKAIAVQTGLSDSQFTELVEGDLKKGDKLITGIQPAISGWGR